ncbi:MAG TPA: DUF4352 domain-containing protein [Thermomicrobiales bacterium]|nr:DUF4352 domain-containing protein [Thermomicrobiales bacterium]
MLNQFTPTRRSVPGLFLTVGLLVALLLGSMSLVAAQSALTPTGTAVTAGPFEITVVEVKLGDDATALATAAGNADAPAEDGLQYVAVHLTMKNIATTSFIVQPDDFAVMGNAGIARRTAAVFMPDPALIGTAQPGASLDGWVLSSVEADASSVALIFDSTTISGTWADHTFALTDGAALNPSSGHVVDLDEDGTDPGSAIGPGRVLATAEWSIKITNVVYGADVNDIVPDSTRRLGDNYVAGGQYAICLDTWIALEIEATNNGNDGRTRYLPQTAFLLADANGDPVLDVRMLSAPIPEISGMFEAGASHTGWIAYELPSLCENDEVNLQYTDDIIRFQPFTSSADPRFLTWDGDGVSAAPTEATINEDDIIPVGTTLVVAKDATVNLRANPSTTADIIEELDEGTEVEITGAPESANGYIWYPITVADSDDEGWVVADFLTEP